MGERMYPVFLDAWQFQCCGETFDVGDEVAWNLHLETGRPGSDEFRVTLSGEVFDVYGPVRTQATGDAFRPHAAVVRVGGLIAQLPFNGEPPWSGLLLEDHHGEVPPWVPATRGTVVRMFVWGVDAEVDPHGATLSPRRFVTREVDTYPRGGFSSGMRDGTTIRGMEEGILAHLQVTQPA